MTVFQGPMWPDKDDGKILLHFVADCSVDVLWEDFFGSYPELQAKLHKQRNDTNCGESPWVSTRNQLPVQQFVWPAPPAGADPGTAAQGKIRKVKFDAAPSLASKAFSSEEVQKILAYQPGKYYLVESEVYTTALYGEHFCVLSRTSMAARGTKQCQLQLVYTIDFKPSLSRLMKPMVAKGVDGGIRGTFSTLKKLLQEQYHLVDLPDTAPPPAIPSGLIPEQHVPAEPPAAAPPAVPAAAPAGPALFALADYIVYQELVASILKMSDPQVVAKGLAMCLTLLLVHILITVLQPVAQYCAVTASAAQAGSGGGLLTLLCWPLGSFISIPTNMSQVVMSLVLIAVANKLLLLGAEVLAAYARSMPVAPARMAGRDSATSATVHVSDGTSANGVVQDARQPAAAAEGVADVGHRGQQRGKLRTPSDTSNTTARTAAASDVSDGSESFSLVQNLGNVMSGWGATMDEGLKALMSGSWSRPAGNESKLPASQPGSGQGPESAAGHTDNNTNTNSSNLGRSISHRHTTSFTAMMDPSGLNIIDDYAQLQHLSKLPEDQQEHVAASPPTSVPNVRAVELDQAPSGVTGEGRSGASQGSTAAADGGSTTAGQGSSALATAETSKSPAGTPSSSPIKSSSKAGSRVAMTAEEGEEQAELQPFVNDDGGDADAGDAGQDRIASSSVSRPIDNGSPATAEKGAAHRNSHKGRASSSPPVAQPLPKPRSAGKIVSFPQNTLSNSFDVDTTAASFSLSSTGRDAGKIERSLARRSASPMLYGAGGGDKGSSSSIVGSRPASRSNMREGLFPSYQALAPGDVGYVVPGEEDEEEVCVEVFEHERVQPFRGWGHTWPGHFLPSDKVGHWGDRSGAPGGQLSMLFDRVAPKPPQGWEWKDEEWQVDLTGVDVEGCDAEGWSYGMDFSWLTWPPAPQSGKPGIKSFVRRRRWIRTRRRLPPGSHDESAEVEAAEAEAAEAEQAVLVAAPVMSRSPLQTEGSGASQSGSGSQRSGGGEAGLMAGLGVGLGGLVGSDSSAAAAATAAVASATAMMNRLMRAVTEGPLPAGSVSDLEAAGSFTAATASTSGTATGVGLASPKQVATGSAPEVIGMETSVDAVNNSEDDSSSSVDSDLVPPRPDLEVDPEGCRKASSTSTQAGLDTAAGETSSMHASEVNTAAAAAAAVVIALDAAVQAQQVPGQPRQERQGDAANSENNAAVADESTEEPTATDKDSSTRIAEVPGASTPDADLAYQAITSKPTATPSSAMASIESVTPATGDGDSDKREQPQEQVMPISGSDIAAPSQEAVGAPGSTCDASFMQSEVTTSGDTTRSEAVMSAPGTVDKSTSAVNHTTTSTATEDQGLMTEGQVDEHQAAQGLTAVIAPHSTDSSVPSSVAAEGVACSRAAVDAPLIGSDWVWAAAVSQDNNSTHEAAPTAEPLLAGSSVSAEQATSPAPPLEQELPAESPTAGEKGTAVQEANMPGSLAAVPDELAATGEVAALVSQSSTGLTINECAPGISRRSSGSGSLTSSRTPRSGAAEGRRVGRRSSSGGAGGSRTGAGGRPKLGAVSLKQSAAEAGLGSSGGSGVISPTATAAAAAANSEWESKAGLTSQSSSDVSSTVGHKEIRLSGSPVHEAQPDSRAQCAGAEVYGADDMGSGLLCADGAGISGAGPGSSGDKPTVDDRREPVEMQEQ